MSSDKQRPLAIEKLTGAIIDACSESFGIEAMKIEDAAGMENPDADSLKQTRAFERLVKESELLRSDLVAAMVLLYGDPECCKRAQLAAADAWDMRSTAKNGDEVFYELFKVLGEAGIRKIIPVFEMFFFLGWHARGAGEDAGNLERMV